jgi:putative chitinase
LPQSPFSQLRDGLFDVDLCKLPSLLETPEILETPSWASTSAAWFWQSRGLNEIMDAGDFLGACALINTGQRVAPNSRINGLAERLSFYSRANRALSGV